MRVQKRVYSGLVIFSVMILGFGLAGAFFWLVSLIILNGFSFAILEGPKSAIPIFVSLFLVILFFAMVFRLPKVKTALQEFWRQNQSQ